MTRLSILINIVLFTWLGYSCILTRSPISIMEAYCKPCDSIVVVGQENSQITDATGNYSFLVPAGTYYLTVKAQGYSTYQSDAISVSEGKEIHSNIALKKQFDLLSLINWNTILIIILFCIVIYNFWMVFYKSGKPHPFYSGSYKICRCTRDFTQFWWNTRNIRCCRSCLFCFYRV